MAALGIPQEKIAKVFKVTEKTLRLYCRTELDTVEALANFAVGNFLYDAATEANLPQRRWHDRHASYRSVRRHRHCGDLLDEDPRPLERDDAAWRHRPGGRGPDRPLRNRTSGFN